MHYRLADAFPLDEPIGFAPIDRYVVNADLLAGCSLEHDLLHLLGNVLPRGVGAYAVVLEHRTHNLRIVVARPKRCHRTLGKREGLVGHHQARIHLFAAADAQAIGAGAVRGVEGEVARLKLGHGMAVLRAGKRKREQVLAFRQASRCARGGNHIGCLLALLHHLHQNASFGQLAGHLNSLGDASTRALLQHHAVDHHVDEVLDLLVEGQRLAAQLRHLAVDANAGEPFLLQVLEELRELAFAARDDRRHDKGALVFAQGQNVVGNLIGGLRFDLAAALRAMGHAHTSEQKAQIIVYLRYRAHRRTRVFAGGFLVDGNGRRKAVDGVEVGLAHLAQELTGIAGKAFHVAALALCVDGVEGKRAFARARKARDDNKLVARNLHVDVFQIVLACALDNDRALPHGWPLPLFS